MGKQYSHLTLAERIEIYRLLESGFTHNAIARTLGRSGSTISREVRRNAKPTKQFAGGYRADRAHDLALRRRRWDARFKMHRQPTLRKHVLQHLAMGWSPETIAGRLAGDDGPMRISHESIYRYIYHRVAQKDWLNRLLPRARSRRGRHTRRSKIGTIHNIPKRRPLAERPDHVNDRIEPGHWEGDLMSFRHNKVNVLVLTERTTRFTWAVRLKSRRADHVQRKIRYFIRRLPVAMRRTLTLDNGTEFARHYKLNEKNGIETFFCDPHSPWQKGSVENTIGRLRRKLPLSIDLARLEPASLRAIVHATNATPRKCLGYRTPQEVMADKLTQAL